MIYIADYFAIALVIILFTFFLDNISSFKRMPTSSKIFAGVLAMTALNALTDLASVFLLARPNVPVWLNMLVNSFYFVTNLVTTSCVALYLFTKILEHTHRRHCRRNAHIALISIMAVYFTVVIANIWTGVLFYFDENGVYCRGPLNSLGYFCTLAQMVFVLICYFRNRDTANKLMRRALLNVFPVIPVCILIQRVFPEIMLNSIIIAFTDVVLFMTFMSQRHGIHAMTELNDRHRFFEEVDHRIAKKEPFQIFLINLKNFGAINQKYGHTVGDEYLYQFAFALEKQLRDGLAFHMNGTVFAVVAPYTYQSISEKQSGVLLDFMDRGIDFDEHHIEAEYIVSHYVSGGEEATATDVYEIMEYSVVKGRGMKQRYARCDQDIYEQILRRRHLRERLEKIDTDHGYEVWYQPIKCLSTGRFCSMEALVRLRESDGSLVSPVEFVPLAEQTGKINSITWFVLEQTCRYLKCNPELEDISVSINLPMSQLLEKGFVPRFMGTVDQAGIPHSKICIEFTERTILENFSQILRVMTELTEAGFRFYLDDFGTGYSNFNCLMQLPFKIIKFDASLVQTREDGKRSYDTIRALARICHGMNMTVIAEGAETQEEALALEEAGVDRIQGYVFARPMSADETLQFYLQ